MKMNDTVARIVELMFEDVEMNDETSAIRDEVMDNCQERYADLVNSGMNEDDAISAVIASLKGMEEVLAPYKHKTSHAAENVEEESGEQHLIYAAHEIHRIDLHLVNEDVTLEPSQDDCYHVLWDAEENPLLHAEVRNGVLRVERLPGEEKRRDDHVKATIKGGVWPDFIKTEKGKIEIHMDGLDDMLKSIGQTVKDAFARSGQQIVINMGGSCMTIQVPAFAVPHVKLQTTSGDIEVQHAALTDLSITTTSGDIDVDVNENESLARAEIRTTSGEVEISAYAEELSVVSTSGDVNVEGRVERLSASTISGDIDVHAAVQDMSFKSVSGDVFLEFEGEAVREIRGSTVSGDIDIELPDGLGEVEIGTKTRSGEVSTRYAANGVGPTVRGGLSTVSGDITIR